MYDQHRLRRFLGMILMTLCLCSLLSGNISISDRRYHIWEAKSHDEFRVTCNYGIISTLATYRFTIYYE